MRKCQLQLNPFPYWVNPVAQLLQTWYVPKIYFNVLLNKLRYFGRQHASTNNDDDVCIFSLQVYRLMIWLMHFTFCWDWFIGKSLWQTISSLYQIVCSKTPKHYIWDGWAAFWRYLRQSINTLIRPWETWETCSHSTMFSQIKIETRNKQRLT